MNLKSLVLFLTFALLTFSLRGQEIFVSPVGNDSNDGSKNFPLKSIVVAKQKAEELMGTELEKQVTVWMYEGRYAISEPLEFKPLGLAGERNLVFKAQKGQVPVISGGAEIAGWSKNAAGFWEADLPETLTEIDVRELFINGKRAIRARFPNADYLRVKKAGADRRTNFFFEQGDFPIPENVGDVELVLLHDWSISRIGVKEIDADKSQLTAMESIGAKTPEFFTIDNWEPNPRYFLENAPEFIDSDYEWVFLKNQNKLQIKLPEGVDPAAIEVMIPLSEGLISFVGQENEPVKNIRFEGITFQYSKWEIPESGYSGVQACHFDPRPETAGWAVVPAAIASVWSENISFIECEFKNFGGSGIWFGTGSKNCQVLDSQLQDISGNGIMIGEGQDRVVEREPWWTSAPEQVAISNTIEDCTISQIGAQFYGAVGIWAGLTAETTIKNNQLFDLPYTGISVGWMWSPVATPARENRIVGNHIHDIMKRLSDGGGIYLLGLQPDSQILDNRIHDVKVNAGKAESNGMFLDEGTTDVLVEGNLVYDIAKSPLRFHRATTNLVKENHFFSKDDNPPIRYNTTKEDDIEKVDNWTFSEGEPAFQKKLDEAISDWEKKQRKIRKR